jgi:hypothetical protein
VPDVRCVGRLPPSEVHLPDELFSSTTTTDRSIHSHPQLFFLIHTSLLPWCCSSHPNGQQNCSFSERWPCPPYDCSFAKLLERQSGARPVRELPYAIAPRGQEHVGGANCYSRWPRAQLGSGSSPVRLLPAVGCRPSLSVAPRGHRRRAPPAPQCPVGANHCAHFASVFLDMLQVFRVNVSKLGLNFLMLQIFNF